MMSSTRKRRLVVRAASAICLGGLLPGCIPIPYISSESAPGVAQYVPAELRSSDHELLILVKATKGESDKASQTIVDAPTFVTGRNLASVTEGWSQRLEKQLGVLVCGGYTCGAFHLTSLSVQTLTTLCVIAPDGRTVELSTPLKRGWARHRNDTLSVPRRDAIVAALRREGRAPFETVDGPCGVFGDVDWDKDARKRVTDFLARLADREQDESLLAQVLRDAAATPDVGIREAPSVMILATASWRERAVAEVPLFLAGVEFGAFEKALSRVKAHEAVALLPANVAGARAPENFGAKRFCIISSDGRVLSWSIQRGAWEQSRPTADWIADLLGAISGEGSTQGWAEACAPDKPSTWSEEQRRATIEFVERLPTRKRVGPNEVL
jgi:hypothetical protein